MGLELKIFNSSMPWSSNDVKEPSFLQVHEHAHCSILNSMHTLWLLEMYTRVLIVYLTPAESGVYTVNLSWRKCPAVFANHQDLKSSESLLAHC